MHHTTQLTHTKDTAREERKLGIETQQEIETQRAKSQSREHIDNTISRKNNDRLKQECLKLTWRFLELESSCWMICYDPNKF